MAKTVYRMAYGGIALVMLILTAASFTVNGLGIFTLVIGFTAFLAMVAAGSELGSNSGTESSSSSRSSDSGGALSSLFGVGDDIHQATKGTREAIEPHQEQIEAGAETVGNALGGARQKIGNILGRQQEEEEEIEDAEEAAEEGDTDTADAEIRDVEKTMAQDISDIENVEELIDAAVESEEAEMQEVLQNINEYEKFEEEEFRKLRNIRDSLRKLDNFVRNNNPYAEPNEWSNQVANILGPVTDTILASGEDGFGIDSEKKEILFKSGQELLQITSQNPGGIMKQLKRVLNQEEMEEAEIENIAQHLRDEEMLELDKDLEKGTETLEQKLGQLQNIVENLEEDEFRAIKENINLIQKDRQMINQVEELVEEESGLVKLALENDDLFILESLRKIHSLLEHIGKEIEGDVKVEESWLEKAEDNEISREKIRDLDESVVETEEYLNQMENYLQSEREEIYNAFGEQKSTLQKARKLVENRITLYYYLTGELDQEPDPRPRDILNFERNNLDIGVEEAVVTLNNFSKEMEKAPEVFEEDIDFSFDYRANIRKMKKMEEDLERQAENYGIKGELDKFSSSNKVFNRFGRGRRFFSIDDLEVLTNHLN